MINAITIIALAALIVMIIMLLLAIIDAIFMNSLKLFSIFSKIFFGSIIILVIATIILLTIMK